MKVKKIVIYPIKGLPGIALESAKVGINGLEHDRIYMIADQDGNLVSQRTISLLTQFRIERREDSWLVSHNNNEIRIHDQKFSNSKVAVSVWSSDFISNEVSVEHSAWFSNELGIDCKLVVMPNKDTRIKKFDKAPYETTLSFADGYPILTLGTESVNFLNNKLENSIKANRFRANILIETKHPHEEDNWTDFKIGEQVKLRNIKPCVRCQVITIDQSTGERGKEPLQTLARYRKFEKGVCFGSNAITLQEGVIAVGDDIFLLK